MHRWLCTKQIQTFNIFVLPQEPVLVIAEDLETLLEDNDTSSDPSTKTRKVQQKIKREDWVLHCYSKGLKTGFRSVTRKAGRYVLHIYQNFVSTFETGMIKTST